MELIILIDTNIFIEVKNKEPEYEFSKRVLDWIDEGRLKSVVSTIVIAEMCAGYHAAGELKEKDDFLTHLLTSINHEQVDVSAGVADEAGRIRAVTGLRLPDALILASGLKRGAECFVTNDTSLKKAEKLIKVLTSKEFVEYMKDQKKLH
jgi:predicted nucleic acid-binding protein